MRVGWRSFKLNERQRELTKVDDAFNESVRELTKVLILGEPLTIAKESR